MRSSGLVLGSRFLASVLSACLGLVAFDTDAFADCTDAWLGITKMTGTFTITGAGSASDANGSFSLNQNITGSPIIFATPSPIPGTWTWAWNGDENTNVNYDLTMTDPSGTSSTIGNGPALASPSGGVGQAYLTIDPIDCTYTITTDAWVAATSTSTSGTTTQIAVPWGQSGGLKVLQEPLPLSGSTLSGSQSITDTTTYPGVPIQWNVNWSIDGVQNCKVDLPVHYRQGAAPWGTDQYDHTDGTIAGLGCAMTSMTMAMVYEGWNGWNGQGVTTPGQVNNLMLQAGDFSHSGGVLWDSAVRDLSMGSASGPLKFDPRGGYKSSLNDLGGARKVLDEALCGNPPHPVIVGVKLSANENGVVVPHHFVLVTAKTDNGYTIADPATGGDRPLSDYGDFETRGVVKDPPGDISQLDIAVADNATLVVTDPAGHTTGIDAKNGAVQQLSNSAAFADAITDFSGSEGTTPTGYYVQMFQPVVGDYKVVVSGLSAGPYSLTVHGFTVSGVTQPPVTLDGTASPGSTDTYVIHYFSADGSMTTVDQSAGGSGGSAGAGAGGSAGAGTGASTSSGGASAGTGASAGQNASPGSSSNGGGCGCRAAGDERSIFSWLMLAGIALAAYGRRRQSGR